MPAELGERHLRLCGQPADDFVADEIELGLVHLENGSRDIQDVRAQRATGEQHRFAADARASRSPRATARTA
jgi:hypothetical protein